MKKTIVIAIVLVVLVIAWIESLEDIYSVEIDCSSSIGENVFEMTDNCLKEHLDGVGGSCEGNICKMDFEFNDGKIEKRKDYFGFFDNLLKP